MKFPHCATLMYLGIDKVGNTDSDLHFPSIEPLLRLWFLICLVQFQRCYESVQFLANHFHKQFANLRSNFTIIHWSTLSCYTEYLIQGDANQNFPFSRLISLKVSTPDPKLVKPKLVWEVAVFSQQKQDFYSCKI